jgi:uncharacterized integral membrane protein
VPEIGRCHRALEPLRISSRPFSVESYPLSASESCHDILISILLLYFSIKNEQSSLKQHTLIWVTILKLTEVFPVIIIIIIIIIIIGIFQNTNQHTKTRLKYLTFYAFKTL